MDDKERLVTKSKDGVESPSYQSNRGNIQQGRVGDKSQDIRVYPSRWYIVLAFSYVTIMQNIVWNTFSPISGPTKRVYGWEDWQIATTNNLAPAAYLLSVIPFSWLMDKKGLRPAVVITSVLIAVGSAVRCFTFTASALTTTIVFFGHFLNGLASTVILSAPPLLSAIWFPPNERTTATSIGSQLGFAGLATSFLFGPYMVHDTKQEADQYENGTYYCGNSTHDHYIFTDDNATYCANVDEERDHMRYFMYTQTGMSALCLILVLVYFPNRPPKPPSITAGIERLDYMTGLKQLTNNRQFWWVVVAYGITTGIFFGWVSVLDVDLDPLGVSQTDAGWIGFLMQLIPSFVAVGVAWLIDYFGGYLKKFAMFLIIVSVSFFIAFLFVVLKVIPFNLPLIYSLLIIGAVFFQPVIPIFYEMGVESAYPVHEGVSAGILQLCPQTMALIFLGLFLIPGIGKTWMNYLVVSTFIATIPVLLVFKETRKRSAVDKHEDEN